MSHVRESCPPPDPVPAAAQPAPLNVRLVACPCPRSVPARLAPISTCAALPRPMHEDKILIVEDEPAIAAVIALKLRQAGYPSTCVADAEEAVAEVRRARYTLAIIDLHLPRVSGVELCHRLAAERRAKSLPVLVITGAAAATPEVMACSNVRGIVAKPFSPRDFIHRVRSVLADAAQTAA